jgi:hypothetical protein
MHRKVPQICIVLLVLAGCAAPTPPSDLWESPDEVAKYDLQYGVVKSVEVTSSADPRYPDSKGAPHMAAYGAAGVLFADGMSKLMADKHYLHTIELPAGETIIETSTFQFPVGTCVSVRPKGTQPVGWLARSKRCTASSASK